MKADSDPDAIRIPEALRDAVQEQPHLLSELPTAESIGVLRRTGRIAGLTGGRVHPAGERMQPRSSP